MFVLLFERSMCIFDIYEYLRFLLQLAFLVIVWCVWQRRGLRCSRKDEGVARCQLPRGVLALLDKRGKESLDARKLDQRKSQQLKVAKT
jgi:hypothetical protein